MEFKEACKYVKENGITKFKCSIDCKESGTTIPKGTELYFGIEHTCGYLTTREIETKKIQEYSNIFGQNDTLEIELVSEYKQKFKEGDLVCVITEPFFTMKGVRKESSAKIGDELVVDIGSVKSGFYSFKGSPASIDECHLELVEHQIKVIDNKPKLKVGDRVKIINRKESNKTGLFDWRETNGDVGKVGIITKHEEYFGNIVELETGTKPSDTYLGIFDSDELELVGQTPVGPQLDSIVEDEAEERANFPNGTIVRGISADIEGHEGIIISDTGSGYEIEILKCDFEDEDKYDGEFKVGSIVTRETYWEGCLEEIIPIKYQNGDVIKIVSEPFCIVDGKKIDCSANIGNNFIVGGLDDDDNGDYWMEGTSGGFNSYCFVIDVEQDRKQKEARSIKEEEKPHYKQYLGLNYYVICTSQRDWERVVMLEENTNQSLKTMKFRNDGNCVSLCYEFKPGGFEYCGEEYYKELGSKKLTVAEFFGEEIKIDSPHGYDKRIKIPTDSEFEEKVCSLCEHEGAHCEGSNCEQATEYYLEEEDAKLKELDAEKIQRNKEIHETFPTPISKLSSFPPPGDCGEDDEKPIDNITEIIHEDFSFKKIIKKKAGISVGDTFEYCGLCGYVAIIDPSEDEDEPYIGYIEGYENAKEVIVCSDWMNIRTQGMIPSKSFKRFSLHDIHHMVLRKTLERENNPAADVKELFDTMTNCTYEDGVSKKIITKKDKIEIGEKVVFQNSYRRRTGYVAVISPDGDKPLNNRFLVRFNDADSMYATEASNEDWFPKSEAHGYTNCYWYKKDEIIGMIKQHRDNIGSLAGIPVHVEDSEVSTWHNEYKEREEELTSKLNNKTADKKVGLIKKIMTSVTKFAKDSRLSKDDKALRQAGFLSDSLNYTTEAIDFCLNLDAEKLGFKDFSEMTLKVGNPNESSYPSILELGKLVNAHREALIKVATDFIESEKSKK